jgi:aminoglycoside phosphotransferase (APT) family kinase protein
MSQDSVSDDAAEIVAALRGIGLLSAGAPIALHALGGGVSCDVYRVDLEGGSICVKRALPTLRVEAEWHAPAERAASEVEWMRLVAAMKPGLAPKILGEDRAQHLFAMEYLPPETHPVWKSRLAAGTVDVAFAAEAGSALARIHAETAHRPDIAARFANGVQFHALRIEPYLLHSADKHPNLAPQIRNLANGIEDSRIALVHGDVSPKNILCGPAGPVFLDAETTCYGDPSFDLAFCLNHLLLKCVWHTRWMDEYFLSFAALRDSYLEGVNWEPRAAVEARGAPLLPALLLARIDGKSPVEYLTDPDDREFVRNRAETLMNRGLRDLGSIASCWTEFLATATYK